MLRSLVALRYRRASTVAIERGLRSQNGTWIAMSILLLGLRGLSRWWRKEEVVWRAELAPGERLEIGHLLESFRDLGEKPPR